MWKSDLFSLNIQRVLFAAKPILILWMVHFCCFGLVFAQVTLPYSEDFETATVGNPGTFPTGWVNIAGDGSSPCNNGGATGHTTCFDWQVNSGPTPTVAPIGPNQDHTTGSGNYIYYEDSGNTNTTVEILTPTFNLAGTTRPRVAFYNYNHWRGDAGTPNILAMDVMNAAGTTVITLNQAQFPTDFAEWMYQSEDLTAYIGSGTIRLRFRVINNGALARHDIAIDDFTIRDEPAPVIDPDACTPIDNSRGAILSSHNNGIYSTNLATGKATLLTTAPVPLINSLAINRPDQLVYYVETFFGSASPVELRAWDYANDVHFIVDSDVSDNGLLISAGFGLGGGAAAFSDNGSLYLGLEQGAAGELNNGLDLVYRVDFVPGSAGRTIAGGRLELQINNGAAHDWGDFVAIGNSLYDFSPNTNTFGVLDLTTLTFTETTGVTGLSQTAADRLGGLWTVAGTIQQRSTADGSAIGGTTTITTDGTTAVPNVAFDAAGCVPAISSIESLVWHDTDSDGVVDAGEPGIANVTLEIYNDINGNGSIDPGDVLLGTTTTNASGNYIFEDLLPGDYIVEVDTSSLPAGSVNTFDEDDGTTSPDDMTEVDVTINETYGTADFGYLVPPGLTADKTVALTNDADGTGSVTPGDTLTYTIQLQNTVQGGVATGITVTDVVPSQFSYVSSSITGGDSRNDSDPSGTAPGTPDGLEWSIAALNPNTSVVLTFQVTVGFAAVGSTVNNQADITGNNFADSETDDPGNPANDPSGPGDPADPTPVTVTSPDSDRDGIVDHLDVDDDNDGIPDVDEAAGNNPNGDEDGDGIPNWQDNTDNDPGNTLGDGSTTDYTDGDGNGIPDVFDPDRDGIASHLDVDADDDGIPDITEAGGSDSNNDGIEDSMYDTDGDSIPDSVDVDQTGGVDGNNDGIDDSAQGGADSDGDGIQNSSDPDADGDGIADTVDSINSGNPGEITSGTPLPNTSTDGDGLPNAIDIDADNDGIPDNIEAQSTLGYIAPTGFDSDNDGLDNAYDPDTNFVSGDGDGPGTPLPITNFDGVDEPDYLDTDSDNDLIPDIRENGDADNAISGTDSDNDGLDDNFEGGNLSDPTDVNDEINSPANDLPDGDSDRNSGGDMDYRDSVELESYTDNAFGSLDQVYYRQTDGSIDEFFVGGAGFPAVDPTGYDVAYYDSEGNLIFTDTNPTVTGSGFLESEYTLGDGLDPNNLAYGTWTAVTVFDGVAPAATLAAQNSSGSTIVNDEFDVFSIATVDFTNAAGAPVTGYDVTGGEDTAFLEIVDPDQNGDPGAVDSITVTVTDSATGDMVTVTLFETGPDTGVFAFSSAVSGTRLGIPLAFCPNVPPNPANTGDGTICVTPTSTLQATYTDPNDPSSVQDTVTNPITVNTFSTRFDRTSGEWVVRWSTATESGNMGFHIYSLTGSQLQRLTGQPVPSQVIDSVEEVHYEFRTKASLGEALILEDFDIFGKRQSHGPFEVQKFYGRSQPSSAINWSAIADEHEFKSQRRQNLGRNALRSANQPSAQKLYVKTVREGVHRITFQALEQAGFSMNGVDSRALALSQKGRPVPIFIGQQNEESEGVRGGNGSYIDFIADTFESLYTKENVYLLEVNPAKAMRINLENASSQDRKVENVYRATVRQEPETAYSFSAPNGDPWFAQRLLAWNEPLYEEVTLDVVDLANDSGAELSLGVWGVTDWPTAPDHHLKVYVNQQFVFDARFDGLVDQPLSIPLPPGLLVEGTNTIGLELPLDTGQPYDLINLNHWELRYNRYLNAVQNELNFQAAGPAFNVLGINDNPLVYRRNASGTVEKLSGLTRINTNQGLGLLVPGTQQQAEYFVLSDTHVRTPKLAYVPDGEALLQGNAEYLIITHPDFMGTSLDRLVALRQSAGLTVKVVDVTAVYAAFGAGILDPAAIKTYIQYAAANLGTKMVVLVGGDTHDYHDYLNQDAVSFIPTLYYKTDAIVSFAPVDALFTDLDNDLIPDLALGRLPVRTEAEFEIHLNKIEAFENRDSQPTALFAADLYDGAQDYSFSNDSDAMAASLPSSWNVSKLYLDNLPVAQARTHLVNAISLGIPLNGDHFDLRQTNRSGGLSLVNFAGHSGPKDWTFSGFFGSSEARALGNQNFPAMFIQWGCWNTYFVAPKENTMGHELLLNPNGGAVGVLGASTLTQASSERGLALELYPRLFQSGMSLGEAVLQAKRAFALGNPAQLDVILGWTILADPALKIQP